jgi:type II secretory ATPase GspE/PulE/Tfp pilus assembly ATPase PilB-like protein
MPNSQALLAEADNPQVEALVSAIFAKTDEVDGTVITIDPRDGEVKISSPVQGEIIYGCIATNVLLRGLATRLKVMATLPLVSDGDLEGSFEMGSCHIRLCVCLTPNGERLVLQLSEDALA